MVKGVQEAVPCTTSVSTLAHIGVALTHRLERLCDHAREAHAGPHHSGTRHTQSGHHAASAARDGTYGMAWGTGDRAAGSPIGSAP
jgi:hypothetical protein